MLRMRMALIADNIFCCCYYSPASNNTADSQEDPAVLRAPSYWVSKTDFGYYLGQIKDNYSNIDVEPVVFCHPGRSYFKLAPRVGWGLSGTPAGFSLGLFVFHAFT